MSLQINRRFARWVVAGAGLACLSACVGVAGVQNVSISELAAPRPDPDAARADARADSAVAALTRAQKLQFIISEHGMGHERVAKGAAGYIPGVPALGIPDLFNVDSATGSGSSLLHSTTFPSTLAVAATWDTAIAHDFGATIAKQLRQQGFRMGLGGGANLAREPRNGRLFEYLGEDPVLAGVMLRQRTDGTQSQHVISTIKHVVGNEQETNRGSAWMSQGGKGGTTTMDERTLRELYLLPFEIAVKESLPQPGNLMCSYNRLNIAPAPLPRGTYAGPATTADWACEHAPLLSGIVKRDWGFKGQVQSDWDAAHSTAKAIDAGLDEEEYVQVVVDDKASLYKLFLTAPQVEAAIASGQVSEARLDDMVRRKLRTYFRVDIAADAPQSAPTPADFDDATAFARKVSARSIVLLKNGDNDRRTVLPLKTEAAAWARKRIAVIGSQADGHVLAGGGSGNTRTAVRGALPSRKGLGAADVDWWSPVWIGLPTPIVKAIRQSVPGVEVSYVGGSDAEPFADYTRDMIDQAVAQARASDVAIVVVAQSAGEDKDLPSLKLAHPNNQDELVRRVAEANPNTIVVVQSGNPVLMPWKNQVAGIVQAWNPGEGGGEAIADVLFGRVNPSAKLPLTFPARDEDSPTWDAAHGGRIPDNPVYGEGLNIGYRWYDAKDIEPLFEFGYGLSYTRFDYADFTVQPDAANALNVSFTVKNSGGVAGAEVAQVYLHFPASAGEPPKVLAGWSKLELAPGKTGRVNVTIPQRLQSIWDVATQSWQFIPGCTVSVGASSRDIRLPQPIRKGARYS